MALFGGHFTISDAIQKANGGDVQGAIEELNRLWAEIANAKNNQALQITRMLDEFLRLTETALSALKAGRTQNAIAWMRQATGTLAEAEMQTRTLNKRLRDRI